MLQGFAKMPMVHIIINWNTTEEAIFDDKRTTPIIINVAEYKRKVAHRELVQKNKPWPVALCKTRYLRMRKCGRIQYNNGIRRKEFAVW